MYLGVLPGVRVMERGLLHSVRHLRHLPNGPNDGHGHILGYWNISIVSKIAERLPVGDLGHSILLGGGMQLCTVDTSQKFIVTGTSSLTKNLMTN